MTKLIISELVNRKLAYLLITFFILAPLFTIIIKGIPADDFVSTISYIRLNLFIASMIASTWPLGLYRKIDNRLKILTSIPITREQIVQFRLILMIIPPIISMIVYAIVLNSIPGYEYNYMRILESILFFGIILIMGFGQYISGDLISFINGSKSKFNLFFISSPGLLSLLLLFATITSDENYLTIQLLDGSMPNMTDYSILCYSVIAVGITFAILSRKVFFLRKDYLKYFNA